MSTKPFYMDSAFEYKPSWRNTGKYGKYLQYFAEYLKYGDFRSLGVSLKYMFAHKLPETDYETNSAMGKFIVRKNTNDFQFINFAYEKAIRNYLVKQMDTFDVFIDLGACIGEYDIWLARQGKRCIAVEPISHKGLVRNIALNKVEDKITVFTCGVGHKRDKVYFEILENYIGASHINRSANKEPNVEIERVDDLLSHCNLSPSDRVIMKLDIEGMEPEAIEGAAAFILSCKDLRIIYEHFKEDNYRNDKALLAIADFSFVNLDAVNRLAIKKV
jgi:FkbM family methyltransferase